MVIHLLIFLVEDYTNKMDMIAGIKSSITFTEKTKFIFAINKGIISQIREKPYDVNDFIPFEERRIPI